MLHMRYAAMPKNSRSPNIGALLINYLVTAEGPGDALEASTVWICTCFPARRLNGSSTLSAPAKGKIIINSPEWLASFKDYAEIQKELEAILRQK